MARHNFQTRNVYVYDYVNGVNNGIYDIYPDFQRDDHKLVSWKQAVIVHHRKFGSIPTIYYHQNFEKNCIENLDGKQRTLAFVDYMANKFTIPKSSGLPLEFCCKYNQLSQANKRIFDMSVIILTETNTQLSPSEVKEFFKNVQKSSNTSPGEKLNANLDSFVKDYADTYKEDEPIYRAIKLISGSNRMHLLNQVMRHLYIKCNIEEILKGGAIANVTTDNVDSWSERFDPSRILDLDEAYNTMITTARFMRDNQIYVKCESEFTAFFMFFALESQENIEKLTQIIEVGEGGIFDNYTHPPKYDLHKTGLYKYNYLVNEFIN